MIAERHSLLCEKMLAVKFQQSVIINSHISYAMWQRQQFTIGILKT